MVNNIKQIKIRFSLILTGFVVIASALVTSGLFSSTTQAVAGASPIEDRVKSYIYYSAWEECMEIGSFRGGRFNDFIYTENVLDGEFFYSGKTNLGYLKPGGPADCNVSGEWLTEALAFWGWTSNVEALCEFNFKRDTPGAGANEKEKCINGDGNFSPSGDRVTDFKRAVELKYYKKQGRPTLDGASNYILYLNAFTNSCGGVSQGPVAGAAPDQKAISSTDTGYIVNVLNAKYESVPTIYKAALGKGAKVDVYAKNESSCKDVVSSINSNLDAYKAYMLANKASEPAPSNTPPASSAQNGGTGSAEGGDCLEIVNPLTWIMCPILGLADGLYSLMTDQIKSLLNLEQSMYDTKELKAAWSSMRTIASALIVLVALVMIASQIFNFEFMSAYTIKKVLPRIIIAAIGIQLSWFIFVTLIEITNAVGEGIYSLMLAPFEMNGAGNDIVDMFASQSGGAQVFSGALVVAVAAGGIVASGGLAAMVAAAIAVSFAIIAAIFTLVLRKMLLIVLLVLAPLAFVAWILPGTKKFWDQWWQLFSKLLLMFPLIMALIASGKIFAHLLSGQQNNLTPLLVIVVYFMPLFLIPATFKFAGGMFAKINTSISGIGNKLSTGISKPWKERAQFNKDNSKWALSRKSRMADRQYKSQLKYGETLNGQGGAYGRIVRRRSGVDSDGRTRAQASAATTITSAKEQVFKDRTSLAEFQIKRLAEEDMKANPNTGETLFEREQRFRSNILDQYTAHGEGSYTAPNGTKIDLTSHLAQDIAIQSLKNKDGANEDTGIQRYLSDQTNFESLANYGTESSAAWQVLAEKLPTAAKGNADARLDNANARGFSDAIKGFAGLASAQQQQVYAGLAAHSSVDPAATATMLNDLARNTPGVDATHLQAIRTEFMRNGLDLDLGQLRNNPNATLEYDRSTGQYRIS